MCYFGKAYFQIQSPELISIHFLPYTSNKETPRTEETSTSEEEFSEDFYEGIEDFLDEEGLFITSPSPISKPKTSIILQPAGLFKRMKSLPMNSESNSSEESSEGEDLPSLPSFLQRRNLSIRVTS